MPFGEEVSAGVGGRTTGQGYGLFDGNRKRWAKLERDDESGLDYAQARYYSNIQGRFTSADEFWKDSDVADPQSWNKYAYVRNNPLNLVDPTGEKIHYDETVDASKHRGTIKITATFAVYASPDAKMSNKELRQQAALIKKQIEGAWKGSFTKDGITYSVSTTVHATAYYSESAAEAAGAKPDGDPGHVDNLIKIVAGNPSGQIGGQAGDSTDAGFTGRLANEDFDRVIIAKSSFGKINDFYSHEFTHLSEQVDQAGINLGPIHIPNLTNRVPEYRSPVATPYDLQMTYGRLAVQGSEGLIYHDSGILRAPGKSTVTPNWFLK